MDNGIYAKFITSKGEILAKLEFEKAPATVGNFVGLAEGKLENDVKPVGTPYYDGLKFHRVVSNFMIQGGCPLGDGTGGPGYEFDDEFHPDLKHNKAGILGMANGGPATNGSQFYITHGKEPSLNKKYAVFGRVIEGQNVVDAIVQGDDLTAVEIIRMGDDAQAFDAVETFRGFQAERAEVSAAQARKQQALMDEASRGFEETASGLRYKILEKGDGKKAGKRSRVSVHYRGRLLDGTVFDSSFERNEPLNFKLGIGEVIAGWDEGIPLMQAGGKAEFVIPAELGYGRRGEGGGAIPPNAVLLFEIELLAVR